MAVYSNGIDRIGGKRKKIQRNLHEFHGSFIQPIRLTENEGVHY